MSRPRVTATLRPVDFHMCEIDEIVANTALNMFTNHFNHIAGTEIDFRVVETTSVAAV